MSLSSSGNQGYLDVTNAILRVGTLDVYGITGVDMVTNVVKQNAVLVWDDQGADMSTPPFQLGAGVTRTTSPPEIDLRNASGDNFMYHGLKLPNQWMAQFDLYLDTGTTGNVHLQMYTSSTTTYDDDGYQFIFDAANSTLTLEYDGTQVQQSAVTYTTGWQTFVVTFNRGAWGVARESDVVFSLDDDERSAVYDNTSGQYLRFETDATTSRKVRYLKFTNSGPWLQSKTGDISFLTGNVSVGHNTTTHKLSVAGSANVGALTATSVNVAGGVDATSTSTGDLTLTGLGVESNIHTSNLYASEYVGVGTASAEAPLNVIGSSDLSGTPNNAIASFRATTAIPGTNDAGVVIGSVNGNLPYIADVSSASLGLSFYTQNNKRMIIKSDGNVAIGTHDPQYKLDVAGTANVGAVTLNSNVYAPNLPLAEVASNLVTWDSTTGDLMDSGGLISNKFAVVSEQPPAALTGDSTVVDGHGRYKVTTSLQAPSYQGWKVFDKTIGAGTTGWSTGAVSAYNVDGTYAGSNVIAGVSGEWVKIEFPYKTTLRHVSLSPNVYYSAMPENFSIVASNDDSNWTVIKSVTGQAWTSADYVNFVVNAGVAYKYYAIVAQLTNTNYAYIGEWRLFTETFTVDAGVVSTTAASGLDVGYTEHPVEPITDFRTYVEGHGTYEASASSYATAQASPEPWRAFDNNFVSGAWRTTGFSNSTYLYTGPDVFVDVGGTRYNGPSLTIKMPYAIVLSHSTFSVWETTYGFNTSPKVGYIFGSNDGVDWYKIFYTSDFGFEDVEGGNIKTVSINATTSYTHYAFVCTEKNNTGTETAMNLNEWRLFAEKSVTRMENVHISGDLSSETLQTGYIKWPKVPLKANESEGYVATRSSRAYANYEAWKAFNENANSSDDAWIGGLTNYTTGGYPITTSGAPEMNGVYGDWLGIELPQSIKVSYIQLLNRNYSESGRLPTSGRFYGSKDNITFTELTAWSNISISPGYEPTRIDVNSNDTYKTYRIQVERLYYGGTGSCAIGELQLFEAATGVGAAPTSAKLQVAGSLGMAKGAEFFAGDDVVMELPKHDRPLVKYPEVKMTANSSGGYVASATSEFSSSYGAWRAFNGVYDDDGQVDSWQPTGGEKYSTANGTWIGGTGSPYAIALTTGTTIYGEWLQLQIPSKIKLKYMNFSPIHISSGTYDNLGPHRSPREGYILGSNDGTNWTPLKNWTGLDYSYWNQYERSFGKIDVNDTNYYKYFRLVWTRTVGGTYAGYASAQEVEYYGTEEGDESVDVVHRSIPNKPSQQHLAVYWDANDSNSYSFADSSNVYDLSGNGVTGTITGNNGFDAEYNAWVFDGSGDYISGTLNTTTGAWVHSFSFWMNADTAGGFNSGHFVTLGAEATDSTSTIRFAGQDQFQWYFWGNDLRFDAPGTIGQWVHIVGTYDGGNDSGVSVGNFGVSRKIFINTKETTVTENVSGTAGSNTLNLTTTSTPFRIGSQLSGGAGFDGKIANVRVFSKKLSIEQIRELYEYDAPRFGHRQNLVALHKGNLGVGVAHPTSRFEVAGADGLQEYPPKAMTGYETYMEGHGVFRASASTAYITASRFPYYAFDKSSEQWLSVYFAYNSDGDYTGNNSLGGISGEWIKLSMPYNTKIKHFIYESTNIPQRNITLGTFLGSNDESTWFPLAQMINPTGGNLVVEVNATDAYAHYALVAEKDVGGNEGYAGATELRLFGTPAPSGLEDGHLTLGKALTLPRVSGHAAGAETPRAESLVVHYDTTVDSVVSGSTVVDISGNGLNGTLGGDAAYSSTDRALTFDGSGDYLYKSGISGWSDNISHTTSFWFKILSPSSGYAGGIYQIYNNVSTTNNYSAVALVTGSSGYVSFYHFSNDYQYDIALSAGIWYHMVTVYPGSPTTQKVYINGENVPLTSSSGISVGSNLVLGTSPKLSIGGDIGRNNYYTDGSISNFKIWNVALTAEEVAAEYALGRVGKSINLTDTSLCLGGTVPRAQLDATLAHFDRLNIGPSSNSGHNPRTNALLATTTNGSNHAHLNNEWRDVWFHDFDENWNFKLSQYHNAGVDVSHAFRWQHGAGQSDNYMSFKGANVGIGVTNPTVGLNLNTDKKLAWIPTDSYLGAPTTAADGGVGSRIMLWKNSGSVPYGFGMEGGAIWYCSGGIHKFYIGTTHEASITTAGPVSTFTGQHRCTLGQVTNEDLVGRIVVAENNKYVKMNDGVETGSNAITINECLPVLTLSTKSNQKSCFGVVSSGEDADGRQDKYGNFISHHVKEAGDTRYVINSVGEGAMWVTDINGSLESGDYITTSNVAGYGQRQDDDVLHNYTVAKITMDCDFNPPDIPVQRILKELANVTYWYHLETTDEATWSNLTAVQKTTEEETYWTLDRYVQVHGRVDEQSNVFVSPDHDLELYTKTRVNVITAEVWEALPEGERAYYSETDANTFAYTQTIQISPETWDDLSPDEQNTYVHGYYDLVVDEVPPETSGATQRTRTVYKKKVNETTEEPENPEEYLSEVRQEWVNVLDEHGQLQWEDVPWGATEKAYNIRYLDANGGLTTRHNAVHTAAFVGVTYHCG
jgi:hypothetical protein